MGGLGKYLINKLAESMQGDGILTVDKIDGKDGTFVYLTATALGLSHKMATSRALRPVSTTTRISSRNCLPSCPRRRLPSLTSSNLHSGRATGKQPSFSSVNSLVR